MSKKVILQELSKRAPRSKRIFSDTFKRQKVQEIEKGLISVSQLSKLYGVSRSSIYKWLDRYSIHYQKCTVQVVQMESESQKTKQLLEQLAELERLLGQKQMQIDYLEKLVEISSDELQIDLKKNFGTKSSTISIDSLNKKASR